MSIQQGYYNRIRYTLYHHLLGSQIIEEPEGWRDDEKELYRNSRYHGIFARFSNSAKYYGKGYDFLKTVYEIDGINANVRLTKDIKHPKTDDWVREYEGVFDFSTYVEENKKISLKFNSDGIEEILKSRESEQIEIERETDLDGNMLPELDTKLINIQGRKIFLKSEWKEDDSVSNISLDTLYNSEFEKSKTIPVKIESQSHEEAQSVIDLDILGDNPLDSGDMFFLDSQEKRTLNLRLNLNLLYRFYFYNNQLNWDLTHLKVQLIKYNNGINFSNPVIVFEDILVNMVDGYYSSPYSPYNFIQAIYTKNQIVEIQKGDSLSLQFKYVKVPTSGIGWAEGGVELKNIKANLTIEEDSYYPATEAKTVLAHELYERVIAIITGKQNAVYSESLGRTDIGYQQTGENTGALTGLSHGMWIRGFDKLPVTDDNKYKPFKTSFKDLHESFYATYGLGLGIEKFGNKERVRVEHLSYFYNRNTTIKLPMQVKNVKRSISTDYFFSALEIGYEKGGAYDEAQGLDEYNTKSNYISCITRVKNALNLVSKYRADMYGAEFARRKPKSRYESQDTSYDQDVFMFDLKRVNNNLYTQRKWQDDFEQEPTGVYDPESATNLRLSPANCLMRNSWYFHSGLIKYPEQFLRFGSSTGNSKLKTKLPGKPELSENEDIQNNQLDRPRFVPEIIEFEHKVDFEINEKLKGSTVILGKKIMNVYGCIEFTNENGEQEKGFLINLKPNGKGQWKLLKAY